ncbi:hypothetical protein [Salinigranum marinum]|uniref:hypothetical protein n=1 Tax=Salinigranum marinum TaxID=1515595 RepID=UPI002989D803|nr:hypothetical protein [Salinigranum marinum]
MSIDRETIESATDEEFSELSVQEVVLDCLAADHDAPSKPVRSQSRPTSTKVP